MSSGTNRTATSVVGVAGMPPISTQPSATVPTHHPIPDPESLEHPEEHSHRHEAVTLPTPPTQSGNSRERSRSHSRSPRRHRHHRRRSRFRFKEKERNFLAAVCSMIVIVTLCTALAEPNWFYMRGGGCRANDDDKSPIHTLGVYQFFYVGHFGVGDTTQVKSQAPRLVYHYNGGNSNDVMINCVTEHIVQVLRSIIVLCFFGVVFSLIAFFLDLAGPSHRMMKTIRRNAVFNILTVVVCVMVNGFSFLITQLLETLQNQTKEHRYSKIDIRFDVSFYLVAAAGAVSVIAAAFNLLRRYPPYDQGSEQRESLLEDYDNMDIGALHGADIYASYTPPPPAYSP